MISLLPEKNHNANPGLGNCRSLYVSIQEKIHMVRYSIFKLAHRSIKKKEKKRSSEGEFIYTPQICDVALLTTSFYDNLSLVRNNAICYLNNL